MKLPFNTIISEDKIKRYLLVPRKRNDKSKWLSSAGYNQQNWEKLKQDLYSQILSLDITKKENTNYGIMYEIKGELVGPKKRISVCTIWFHEYESKHIKFVTMFPDKK